MFSDNLIFFDTEFSDLNIRVGELLSIGLVKQTGEELYLEFSFSYPVHPWVTDHVIPMLTKDKVSKERAQEMIWKFVGDTKPYLVSYVNQFDAMYWYQLFGSAQEHPAFWIPIDFASILFAHGFDPNSMGKHTFLKTLGIHKEHFKEHNALDDARLLKMVYNRFILSINRNVAQ